MWEKEREMKPTSINKSIEITRNTVQICISANWLNVWFLFYPLNANNWMTFKIAVALEWAQCFIYYSVAHYHPSNIEICSWNDWCKIKYEKSMDSWMESDAIISPFVLLLRLLNFYDSQRWNLAFFYESEYTRLRNQNYVDGSFQLPWHLIESNRLQNISNPILWKYWLNFIRIGIENDVVWKNVLRESVIAPCNTCYAIFSFQFHGWMSILLANLKRQRNR